LTKIDYPEAVSRLDDGSPFVRVGIIGFELPEIDKHLEATISNWLRGP
jgi:hypothetical protein